MAMVSLVAAGSIDHPAESRTGADDNNKTTSFWHIWVTDALSSSIFSRSSLFHLTFFGLSSSPPPHGPFRGLTPPPGPLNPLPPSLHPPSWPPPPSSSSRRVVIVNFQQIFIEWQVWKESLNIYKISKTKKKPPLPASDGEVQQEHPCSGQKGPNYLPSQMRPTFYNNSRKH